nr:FliM/FliN family flagellar motor C-terminal domain-containing protein [Lentibacter algarum]
MQAEACLPVIIHRQKMSLAQLAKLQVGDVLALPEGALERLEIGSGVPQKIGPCQLGQHEGQRAVQLRFAVRPSSDEFGESIEQDRDYDTSADSLTDLQTGAAHTSAAAPALIEPNVTEAPTTELPDLSDLPGFESNLLPEVG